MNAQVSQRIAIVDGVRTPFVKAGTVFRQHTALDLAVHSVNGLLTRQAEHSNSIDALACGIVVVDPRIPHLAREVVFGSKLENRVRALTLTDNCITGISAMASIANAISQGRITSGVAAGVESMSNPALMFSRSASRIFMDLASARSLSQRLATLLKLRPGHFKPNAPGIVEPSTGLSMGEHVELMVKDWKISRQEQDRIALQSHLNAQAATDDGRLTDEIIPLEAVTRDQMIRADTSMERLAGLQAVFDKSPTGTVTAGNSSPLTDGAASLLLMSESKAMQHGIKPLAYIRDFEFASIDPAEGLLMAPAVAVPRLLNRQGLSLEDIDIVEMHEAFGGQVACNLRAWGQGWKASAIGEIDAQRLNPLGSSIAIGHPFAATGIRIATTLANEMARRKASLGLISICGAGATAAAMLLEGATQ